MNSRMNGTGSVGRAGTTPLCRAAALLIGMMLGFLPLCAPGQNLVSNGGFESGYASGWTHLQGNNGSSASFTEETVDTYEGSRALKVDIIATGSNAWDVQTLGPSVALTTGQDYTLTFWGKAATTGTQVRMVLQNVSWLGKTESLTTGWAQHTWNFTAAETSPQLKIHYLQTGTVRLDNIQLLPVAGTGATATVTATDPDAYEDGLDAASFTVSLAEPAASDTTVLYSVGGTAASGSDFTALSGSVLITTGQSNAVVTVTPVASDAVEASETVTLTIQPGAGYSVGATSSATATIYDYSAPSGTSYYVKTDGNDANTGLSIAQAFQTIQKGADVAGPGDTVYVLDGTYHNSGYTTNHNNGTTALNNPNLLTIATSGTAGNYITFRDYPDGNSTKPKLMYDGAGGIKIGNNVSYIVINGFEIEGPAKTITYDQAATNRWTKPNYYSGRGIYSWGPGNHIYISNCDSHHSCGSGLRFNKGDYIVFENNVIANNTWWSSAAESGIVLAESTNIDTKDIVKMLYARNTLYNNWNRLPFCNPPAQGTGNYGDGFNYQGGKIIDGQGLYVTRNNATYAFGRMRMENNVAYNNGFNGMVYHKTDRGELINNTIYMNGAWPGNANYSCLTMNTANDVKAYNNILWARSSSHYAVKDNGGNTAIDMRHNDIPVGMTQFSNVNGTNADPLLVNAPDLSSYTPTNYAPDAIDDAVRALGIDFHLQSSSPVIDAGIATLAASGDRDMDSRPQGAGVDIGADEAVITPVPEFSVTIASSHGNPIPAGTTMHDSNTVVVASLPDSPVMNGTTQYVATGWAGTGSATNGSGTNTSFTITADSTVTWRWQTNYWVSLSASGEGTGTLDHASAWYESDTNITTLATPGLYSQFDQWQGDTNGAIIAGDQISFGVTEPRSIVATFRRAVTASNSVPHDWLANQNPSWTNDFEGAVASDPDGDGFTTAEEYWCGTDPQSSSSFLHIVEIEGAATNMRLVWTHSQVDTDIYPICIQSRTSLTSGAWVYAGEKAPLDGTNTWSIPAQQTQYYRLCVTNAP